MSKCINCQAELLPQSRFCGACGTTQPSSISGDDPENMETLRSNPPSGTIPSNIPPPPPQPNFGGAETIPPSQEEYKRLANSSPAQPHNPPSGPYPQPPALYGNQPPPANPQQPYSNYQPAPQTPPPSYGGYPYGQQSQPDNYQQPYGQYQQPPSQPYNDYPQNPSGVYSQNPSGVYPPNSATVPNTNPTGAPPSAPGWQPTPTPGWQQPKPKRPSWLMWAIIGVVVVVILAGAGIGLAVLLKPHLSPTISVTSQYYDNGTPAGATDTTLHVTGKQFASNSTITFLLDNTAIRQDMQTVSNANGNFTTDLTVTSAWSVGLRKLTAQDANNNTTGNSTTISIVQQGYNKTPGTNGAPTNTANFKVSTETHLQSGSTVSTYQPELDITGQSDSQGGTVCSPGDDGSQQKNQSDGPNGTTLYEVYTTTCSGTYKNGHITYNDTLDTDVYSDGGGTCTLSSSQSSWIQMTGDYTASHQFSGTIVMNSIDGNLYNCTGDLGSVNTSSGATGTWTGGVSNS